MLEAFATTGQDCATGMSMSDLACSGIELIETLANIQQSGPKSLIVIVSIRDDRATIDKVFEFGSDACAVKSNPARELLEALMAGRAEEAADARTKAVSQGDLPDPTEMMDLTKRQREILGLLRDGQSNKEIGRTLGLSPFTVRNHIAVLMRRLRVHSRGELATMASGVLQ